MRVAREDPKKAGNPSKIAGSGHGPQGGKGGEFLGLNGGADFYGKSLAELKREGAASLKVFLEMCAEKGIEPERNFSGRLMLRIPPAVHASAIQAAAAHGMSLNQWAAEALLEAAHA